MARAPDAGAGGGPRPPTGDVVAQLFAIAGELTGVQLDERHREMVKSRMLKRVDELGLPSLEAYLAYYASHRGPESPHIISLLTTHHSYFFREFAHFRYLIDTGLAQLLPQVQARPDRTLRVWSAACSRGQEVYSLAMLLDVHLRALDRTVKYTVLGTDVDEESLAIARNGVYRRSDLDKAPPALLQQHWAPGSGEISDYVKARDSLRGHCQFARQNIFELGPTASETFDIIFCRNVFIYFNQEQIRHIAGGLLRRLRPGGYLFAGISESLTQMKLPLHSVGPSIYRAVAPTAVRGTGPAQAVAPAAPAVPTAPAPRYRVLVVDDSRTMCELLARIIAGDPQLEVVGMVNEPERVEQAVAELRPHVVTLDIHMGAMSGVDVVRQVFPRYKIPFVMISSASLSDGSYVVDALLAGAVDYIQKPAMRELGQVAPVICEKLRDAAGARAAAPAPPRPRPAASLRPGAVDMGALVAIGSSTGGIEALHAVFMGLPAQIPAVVVVQHIPAVFSRAFAERMDALCPFTVKEAEDGDPVAPNCVLIAPGGLQMGVRQVSGTLRVSIVDAPPVGRHKPAVDYLFAALAALKRPRVAAAVLTGMGADGARGLLELRRAGARTLAQDEASSVVYGMPREAARLGAAEKVVPLAQVAETLMQFCQRA